MIVSQISLDGCKLQFVSKFRYLGHIISDDLSDDDDIRREIKNLFVVFVRTNMLISRFYKCSSNVKLTLFKSFCMAVHDMWLSGKSFQLFSISSDLVITDASRSCLDFRDVIVCLVFLWIYVCKLLTLC